MKSSAIIIILALSTAHCINTSEEGPHFVKVVRNEEGPLFVGVVKQTPLGTLWRAVTHYVTSGEVGHDIATDEHNKNIAHDSRNEAECPSHNLSADKTKKDDLKLVEQDSDSVEQ